MSNQSLSVGTATHPGLKRPVNEDALGTPPVALDPATLDAKGCLYLVADGMGREGNGAVASQLAVKRVLETYYADPSPDPRESLHRAIQIANAEIIQQAAANPAYQGMGTTLTAVVIRGNALLAANVGDSRAYLVRGSAAHQLTLDHSWVAEEVRAGCLTPTQAQTHPQRRLVTRSLGAKPDEQVDFFQQTLQPGDAIVLCTDGLSDVVSDGEIARAVAAQPPQTAADQLVTLANQRGGPDNVTVVVVQIGGKPAAVPAGPLGEKSTVALLVAGAGGLAIVLLCVCLVVVLGTGNRPGPFPPGTAGHSVQPRPGHASSPGQPTSTVAPTNTPAPPITVAPVGETPTVMLRYPAPVVLEPPDGADYVGPNAVIEIQWQPVGTLATDEYYVVTFEYPHEGETWHDQQWTRSPALRVPPYLYGQVTGDRVFHWNVTVIRLTGTRADGTKDGAARSEPSETRRFTWRLVTPPQGGPSPTPTFEKR